MPKKPLNIVCCVILDDKNRILLLQRHFGDLGGGLWATPGGKLEPNENPLAGVMREVKGETGIDLDKADFLGTHEMRMPHGVAHMQTFKAIVNDKQEIVINKDESEDYKWFDLSHLLNEDNIIWGLPTTLLDFGLIEVFQIDPTLADGSQAILLAK